jgi:chromosome segregation ATPase
MIPHLSRRTKLAYAERDVAALQDTVRRLTSRLHATEVQRNAAYRHEQEITEKLEAARIVFATESGLLAKAEAERDALARRLADAEARLAGRNDVNVRHDLRCASSAVCASMVSRAGALDHLLAEQSAVANGFTPDWAEAIPDGDAA